MTQEDEELRRKVAATTGPGAGRRYPGSVNWCPAYRVPRFRSDTPANEANSVTVADERLPWYLQ